MSALVIREPAKVRLEGVDPLGIERARRFLTFKDSSVAYMLSQHRKKVQWRMSDPEGWEARKEELEGQLKRCILFQDEEGYYTYSGLADELSQPLICNAPVQRLLVPPAARGMAWERQPEHEARYYQREAVEALLGCGGHGALELPTGAGKSFCLVELVHRLGLKTLVVAPSTSILIQLVKDFERYFGKRYVGQYGDGKKKYDKLITVATFQSLTRLEPGDEAWEELSKTEVFAVDESHISPASTLEKVCMGLAKNASYRFFVSATQLRGDGSDIVLKGITGPIVYRQSMSELVDGGFLAKPTFHMIRVRSDSKFESPDVMKMTRIHHYYNPRIIERAAEIANKAVALLGHKVLIQIDEIAQFQHLLRHLQHQPRFAHGAAASDKDLRSKLPEQYWNSDPPKLVDQFNNEEFSILVATSCCGMGTDFKTPETIINLVGGCSPISTPQAVGRGTRKHTFLNGRKKTAFNFIDIIPMLNTSSYNDSMDGDSDFKHSPMYRHGLVRAKMYEELYPNVRWS